MLPSLPDRADPFVWENGFYLTASPMRLGKALAQWELFKRIVGLPGAIVECGVFKGCSLARLAMFRSLIATPHAKPIVAFDTFGEYAPADTARDHQLRERLVGGAGTQGVSVAQMQEVLRAARCDEFVELVPGDICETVPRYTDEHPELRIALLNLDVDFGRATTTILEELWPLVVKGGIVMIDDYGVFEGATRVSGGFFHGAVIERFPYAYSPSFIAK